MRAIPQPVSFYILGYLLELIEEIWQFEFFFFFLKFGKFGHHFSHEKSFVLVEITFFRLTFCKNSPITKKKTLMGGNLHHILFYCCLVDVL
jgi:hypothetical protein